MLCTTKFEKAGLDMNNTLGLCRNTVDHINDFDNDDLAWVIIIKIVNVINSIPAQALAAPY